jgi:hypothetical protein
MIDKQAIDAMTEILTLISKYANGAYPEVETEASRENRRRAWAFTKMLARLAENAAESDFYFLLSDNVNSTNAERKRCYQIARQEDLGIIHELHNFHTRASEYESNPATGRDRTDGDIVRELEIRLDEVKAFQELHKISLEPSMLTKKERDLRGINQSAIAERLTSTTQEIAGLERLALTRGMVVSLNRHRTVIKRVDAVPMPSAKPAVAKAKKTTILKLVATKTPPQSETKTSRAKKSA